MNELHELAVVYEKKAIANDRLGNLDLGFHFWLMLDVINQILSKNPVLTENILKDNE